MRCCRSPSLVGLGYMRFSQVHARGTICVSHRCPPSCSMAPRIDSRLDSCLAYTFPSLPHLSSVEASSRLHSLLRVHRNPPCSSLSMYEKSICAVHPALPSVYPMSLS